MTDTPAELATRLVNAFGHPDDIVAVLSEDATWWITPALPPEIMQSVTTGREEIRGNMQRVFSMLYNGETVSTAVHSAISEGSLGTVRFTMTAQFPNGGSYCNEYCICVETRGSEIVNVWEYTDGAYALITDARCRHRHPTCWSAVTGRRESLREELLAERNLSVDTYWAKAEAALDWPLEHGVNMAHEACDRWAYDRARIALSVHDPTGGVTRWSYHELMTKSRALANAFIAAGLQRGDRVAAILDQQIEAYLCALAAWRAGLVYVPLFVGFGSDAVAQRLNDAEPAAVVVDHRHRQAYATVQPKLSSPAPVWTVAGAQGLGIHPGDTSFWQAISASSPIFETVRTDPTECATLIYTSGTTGNPKGCLHPHGMILPIRGFVRHVMALGPDDLVFAGANPGWSYGLYAAGMGVQSLGVSRVVCTGAFDAQTWLRVMSEEEVTYVVTAPSAYRPLVAAAGRSGLPRSVRGGMSAGEACTATLSTTWTEIGGGTLQDAYGSSEMGFVLANLAFDDVAAPGALTSVLPGYDVALVNEGGEPQPSEGIVGIRNPKWPIIGYRGLEEAWKAKTVGGVFLSGDIARRDDKGLYWFAGRHDDVIVTAGYNVGPTEVENLIEKIPGVKEVAVVAEPDESRGAVVRAVVVEDGSVARPLLTGQIQQQVKAQLGRHAYPKIVDYLDVLPRTEVGKIRRNVLRENR